MNSDCFFTKGTTHKICQDYTEVGDGFAVLSDGCSSGPETHIGALLVTRAARSYLSQFPASPTTALCEGIMTTAFTYAQALALQTDALLTTLLTVKVNPQNQLAFQVMVCGDGVIAARRRTGIWVVKCYQFKSGAPYYLRYNMDERIKKDYTDKFGTKSTLAIYEIDPVGGKIDKKSEYNQEDLDPFCSLFPLVDFDTVAVMSDGATQFMEYTKNDTSKRLVQVPLTEVLKELLSFKNFTGEFVQRRCQVAFKRFAERGWMNLDDFSMAAVYNPTGGDLL